MVFVGILQTGDVDEALELAQRLVAEGQHIRCNRIGLTPEQEIELMERDPEGYVYAMNEHDPVEYEVHRWLPDEPSKESVEMPRCVSRVSTACHVTVEEGVITCPECAKELEKRMNESFVPKEDRSARY